MDYSSILSFDYLNDSLALLLLYSFLVGACFGSFLNVVIYRLPLILEMQWKADCCELLGVDNKEPSKERFNLCTPRSNCPSCKNQIRAIENIPILSYLFLKGRCRYCNTKISLRYPFIELITALLTCVVVLEFGLSYQSFCAVLFTYFLIVLSGIDFDTHLLPDNITLLLLWLGIIFNYFNVYTDLSSSVLGAVFGYMSLWLVFQIFKAITGKEGMGYGDFKLLAALGAWLGWQSLPLIILLSSAVGATVGIIMIATRLQAYSKPIPFGPYLALAGWIAMLYGNKLIDFYFANLI